MAPTFASGVLVLLTVVATHDAVSAQPPQDVSLALDAPAEQDQLNRRSGLSVLDVSLQVALTALARSAGIELAYSPSMLPDKVVTCACKELSVSRTLGRLLSGTPFFYSVRGERILIIERSATTARSNAPAALASRPAATAVTGVGVSAKPIFIRRLLQPYLRRQGTVTGVVTSSETGQPLNGAQITIEGTGRGATTNSEGQYRITEVPPGTYTVAAQFLGYNTVREAEVVVESGATAQIDFALETAVLALQQITVTASTDPIEGVRRPFTVSRIGAEQLQVPSSGTVLASLAGKVAGAKLIRSTGQPGAGVNMMLRSPTGHQTGNSPLIIIDGVVIGRTMDATTMDFESLDIESVEVIKGAAAASLYGSRASAGVIAIETNRGADNPLGETRITSRTEFGGTFLGSRTIPQATHHSFLMNEAGTSPVDQDGQDVDWSQRVASPTGIADQPYPGLIYDNLEALYTSGPTFRQSLTLSQNTESTTYLASFTHFKEEGALEGDDGIKRSDARFTADHRVGDRLNLSLTGRHMRTHRSNLSGDPNINILRYPVNVDLTERDEAGSFIRRPASDVSTDNPLWRQYSRDNYQDRTRTTASANASLRALDWLRLDAQLSYDRFDANYQVYVPKGTPTGADDTSDGQIEREHLYENAYDGSLGATLMRRFGGLDARLAVRGTFELAQREQFGAIGLNLIANGVRSLDAARDIDIYDGETDGSIGVRDERANGYFANLGLNFRDKLTGEFRVRRDGSSLFGEEERWHTYFGGAAAYRLSEEPWFNLPHVDELKVRYAVGEAGGRPGYSWQWERWQVDRIEGLTRFATAGNSQLRPHFTREQEVGLDLIALNNRLSLELVYAWHMSRDQMITVPATVISGYSSVRANAGVMTGRTFEATVEVFPIRSPSTTWSLNLVMDNSKNFIKEWDRSCFFGSNAGRYHEFNCAGERMGAWWVETHATRADKLPLWLQDRANEFAINDDGYLVWVGIDGETGQANSFTDGIEKGLWGQQMSAGGLTYNWGEPFIERDEAGFPIRVERGNSEPDLTFGLGTNLKYRNFSIFGQFRGQLGGRIYNRTKHFMYALGLHGDVDQADKPDEYKKPVAYYQRGLADDNDCTGTGESCVGFMEHFLENGTYLKLGELSVAYSFGRDALQRLLGSSAPDRLTLRVNAQNLFTLVNGFTGYDPERGTPLSRIDTPGYPHMRSLTGVVEITF